MKIPGFIFIWVALLPPLAVMLEGCHKPSPGKQVRGSAEANTLKAIPPPFFVSSSDTLLRNSNRYWYYNGLLLNGYITEADRGTVVSETPVLNGLENGWAYGRYATGKKKYRRYYRNGLRQLTHTGWHLNGTVAFVLHFKNDKYQGAQYSYFSNGRPFQVLNYVSGYEEGVQKTWNEEGRLVNNFTVKKGKLYGVVGRYDCTTVHAGS